MPIANTARRPPIVLVADDNDVSRALMGRLLIRDGYSVRLVSDAHAAIDAVHRRKPNLVLLDLRLPDLDGSSVLSELRQHDDAVALPIIMVSAVHDGEVVAACLGMGANDFVTKPIHWPTLRARMQTHLSVQAARSALRARSFHDQPGEHAH
jgi:sigma-B regulation protein RsbU (phosphoserine phosphatase)